MWHERETAGGLHGQCTRRHPEADRADWSRRSCLHVGKLLMHRLVVVPSVVAVVLAMASPSLGASSGATAQVVVRPVTAGGLPAAGFHIIKDNQQSDAVDCSSPNSSPGAAS